MCARSIHYSVDLRSMQTYTEPVPLKCGKFATKCAWIYEYFLQCELRMLNSYGNCFTRGIRMCIDLTLFHAIIVKVVVGAMLPRDKRTCVPRRVVATTNKALFIDVSRLACTTNPALYPIFAQKEVSNVASYSC